MKIFNIYYNDNTYCGTMTFKNDNITQQEIESKIQKEIENNNKNPNPMYHITRKNFKEV